MRQQRPSAVARCSRSESSTHGQPLKASLHPHPALLTGAESSGSLIPVPAVQKQEWKTSKVVGSCRPAK